MNHDEKLILTTKDIMRIYGLTRKIATQLLSNESCPTLPRSKNQPYMIYKTAWEAWLERGAK